MNKNDEMLSNIEKELTEVLEKYRFEFNTKELRERIKEELEYILRVKYAFFDKQIEENFVVKVDEENNNPTIVASGIVKVDLTVQPKNSPEKFIISSPLNIVRTSDIEIPKIENNFELDVLIEKYLEGSKKYE